MFVVKTDNRGFCRLVFPKPFCFFTECLQPILLVFLQERSFPSIVNEFKMCLSIVKKDEESIVAFRVTNIISNSVIRFDD